MHELPWKYPSYAITMNAKTMPIFILFYFKSILTILNSEPPHCLHYGSVRQEKTKFHITLNIIRYRKRRILLFDKLFYEYMWIVLVKYQELFYIISRIIDTALYLPFCKK